VIWRGTMGLGAVRQFLRDTLWGTKDFLIVDLRRKLEMRTKLGAAGRDRWRE